MKILRYTALLCTVIAVLCIGAFAKTHKVDVDPVGSWEYTLEAEDKLSAELFIDEDGLFGLKVKDLYINSGATPKISVKILDGSKEIYSFETKKQYTESEFPDGGEFEYLFGLTEGEYTITVENPSSYATVSFTLETVFTPEENIEDPYAVSFEKAMPIELNTTYYGGVSMLKDTDFYRFEVKEDGYAYVRMYSPELKYFTLYDKDRNEIGSIGIEIDEADKVYELKTGLAKGVYYISVQPDDNYVSPLYSIRINFLSGDYFEKEYNNETDAAMPIKSGFEYRGNLFGIYDEDVYTFTLAEKSNVTIDFTDTLTSKDGHYSIWLTDGKNSLFSCDECGRKTQKLTLEKGTYYFTVASLGESRFTDMAYKIKISSDNGFADKDNREEDNTENVTPPQEVEQFTDVADTKWYYGELLEAKKLGLIEGTGDGLYKPEDSVTVAEIIAMASRLRNDKGGENTPLTNSDVGKWYNSYITFAVNAGIIKRDDFEDFDKDATRAEVAYVFANLLGEIETDKNTIISDVDESTKYCNEIHKLYAAGILKGDGDGKFRPDDSITRAEAAAILLRVYKAI